MIGNYRFYRNFLGDSRWAALHKAMRLKVAGLVDRYTNACWADLVMWAIYPEHEHSLRDAIHSGKDCEREAQECGSCYCNKFQKD